jgi:hypothetical protein
MSISRSLIILATAGAICTPIVLRVLETGSGAGGQETSTAYALVADDQVNDTLRSGSSLKHEYTLRLASAWPSPAGETDECNNRSSETLAGALVRVDAGHYGGRLVRQSDIGFCGSHPATGPACSARLQGVDTVDAVVELGPATPGGHESRIAWRPRGEGKSVESWGSCDERFSSALRRMYGSVTHSLELVLPERGAGLRKQALDDWGWTGTVE